MYNINAEHSLNDSFKDFLARSLNNKSNSRPPKMALTGILIPCLENVGGEPFRFKLGTSSCDYYLRMSGPLAAVARRAQWEEVTVKGYLELDTNIFDVERLIVTEPDEPFLPELLANEAYSMVIETFTPGQHIEFSRVGVEPKSFSFASVRPDFYWKQHLALDNPGARPKIVPRRSYYGAQDPGTGSSWGSIPELVVRDIDGDGLNDFQLTNDKWIGYRAGKIVIK